MYGITTTAWREFLEGSLGITPTIALAFQTALHQCTQKAIGQMWKARNLARHGMSTPSEIWELRTFEGAIRSLISEEERKGRVLVEGTKAKGDHGILDDSPR